MAKSGVAYDVRAKGPLFRSGTRNRALEVVTHAGEEAIADEIYKRVHLIMEMSFRHPTGYYQSQVRTEQQLDDLVVTDGGVVYGPWLEGVSSRNQTTRFKGYAMFRRATAEAAGMAVNLADQAMGPAIERWLN